MAELDKGQAVFVGRTGFPVPIEPQGSRLDAVGIEAETAFDSRAWLISMSRSQRGRRPDALTDLDPDVLEALQQISQAIRSDLHIPGVWLESEAREPFVAIGENLGLYDRLGAIGKGEPSGDLMALSIAQPLYRQNPGAGRNVLRGYVYVTEDNQQGFAGGHPGLGTFQWVKTNYLEGIVRDTLGLEPLNQSVTPSNRHKI